MHATLGTMSLWTVLMMAGALCAPSAHALPYSVLLESNADRSSNEIYLANYGSYADLLSNTLALSSAYSDLNVSSSFSVGGFTRNGFNAGNGYTVLLESDADRSTNEIYLANYATHADLLSNTLAANSGYSALNVSSSFSVGGLTFDGQGYIVLLESNADRASNEIYLAYYESFDDLLTNTLGIASGYSQLNVASTFSVGGLTYESGGGFSVLLESDLDRASNEIFIAHYASYADLLSNTLDSTSAYSDLNVASTFSVGGLAADVNIAGTGDNGFPGDEAGDGGGDGGDPGNGSGDGGGPGGTPIPEPPTLGLLALALAGWGWASRRRGAASA